jgi:hypothetical protein
MESSPSKRSCDTLSLDVTKMIALKTLCTAFSVKKKKIAPETAVLRPA